MKITCKAITQLLLVIIGLLNNRIVVAEFNDLYLSLEKYVMCLIESKNNNFIMPDIKFNNAILQKCAHMITEEGNLKPLERLWHEIKRDGDMVYDYRISEFCFFILVLYESAIAQIQEENSVINQKSIIRSSWFSVISFYVQLSSLPLAKLIETLEECWNQYQKILQGYVVEGEYSLNKWLSVYWWIFPASIVWVLFIIGLRQKI